MNMIKRPHPLPRQTRAQQGRILKAAVVIILAMAGAGVFVWAHRPLTQATPQAAAEAPHPAAYTGSEYYSPAFVAEQQKVAANWQTSGTLVAPGNFSGRWFNSQLGHRITFDQPALVSGTMPHTVWLVGGSAVFNGSVPDAFTFASQLQNTINQNAATNGWRVENTGADNVQSAQQTARLQTLPVAKGDVVVFFDGAEDALRSAQNKAGVSPSEVLNNAVSTYGNALNDAARYAREHNARFMQVLQPMLFTQPALSSNEQQIAASLPAGQEAALRNAYAQFQKALPQLAVMNKWEYADFTPILNGPDEYYVDCCNTTERAGALIAGHLYQVIFRPQPATQGHE